MRRVLAGLGTEAAGPGPGGGVFEDNFSNNNTGAEIAGRTADNGGTNDGWVWTFHGSVAGDSAYFVEDGSIYARRENGQVAAFAVGYDVGGVAIKVGGVSGFTSWRNNGFWGFFYAPDLEASSQTFVGIRNFSTLGLYRHYEGFSAGSDSIGTTIQPDEEFRIEFDGVGIFSVYTGPGAIDSGGTFRGSFDATADIAGARPKWGQMQHCGFVSTSGQTQPMLTSVRFEAP